MDKEVEVIGGYRVHPAASLFPFIEGEEWEALVASVSAHGILHPITVRGDELIDGRNRLRAVEVVRERRGNVHNLGNIPVRQWDDAWGSPADFIWSSNGARRHMTNDALALVCGQIMPMIMAENEARKKAAQFKPGVCPNPGGKPKKPEVDTKSCPPERDIQEKHARSTVGKIAEAADVSFHKARQVVKVLKAVETGELPKDVVSEVVAGKKTLKEVAPKPPRKPKPPKPEPLVEPDPVPKPQVAYRPSDHEGSLIAEFQEALSKWSGKQLEAVKDFLRIWDGATKSERDEIRATLETGEQAS